MERCAALFGAAVFALGAPSTAGFGDDTLSYSSTGGVERSLGGQDTTGDVAEPGASDRTLALLPSVGM
ncbi:hypothetical protein HNR23_001966 [Nocardiopsis mwathae]|uniref:Uncharacterized protein n=1 Tax=Nocardiopsis mwathae TaxID=1472723 RepID=A0A7X0D5Q8_9ACTN|nr:hypothetical protein [Nocardiopsis mwathae]MBB6171906.1 hypothetical protein [Nocardiopsis mwathae]